jgi:membrane-bound ClpP family serine protease
MIDAIFYPSVTLFEELIWDADPGQDLHLLLDSPGGDGETAVRLARAAQSRCKELTVIVPNQAKSAGTILLMGANHVLMGPTSDLGPVDPQFPQPDGRGLFAAKDLIAAVEAAEKAIANNPESYPLYASLLADVTAVMVQQARSAMARTDSLVEEALASNPDRTPEQVTEIALNLKKNLVDLPREHGQVFGAHDAQKVGLPVVLADPKGVQWRVIWRLWTRYFALNSRVYEGRTASQVLPNTELFA